MDIEKIKKSETTLASIVFTLLIVMGVFTGMYLWLDANSQDVAVPITDTIYNETYIRIQEKQTSLDTTMGNFRDSIKDLTEPGANFGISWNGLLGLLGVFLIPLQFVDMGVETLNVMIAPIALVVPAWLVIILKIGIIAFIVLIIASIFKGDNNVIR